MRHQPFNFRYLHAAVGRAVLFWCVLLAVMCSGCMSGRSEAFLKEVTPTGEQSVPAATGVEMDDQGKENAGKSAASDVGTEDIEPAVIYVDIEGAVADPGVKILPEGSRVFQAIEAAGGFLEEAAGLSVNQAELLQDGWQIYVPTQAEAEASKGPAGQNAGSRSMGMPADYGVLDDGSPGGQEKVNLNEASLEQLMTLSGIGEAKARAIISYREDHGLFGSETELMQVEGIKEGTFEKIKNQITVR